MDLPQIIEAYDQTKYTALDIKLMLLQLHKEKKIGLCEVEDKLIVKWKSASQIKEMDLHLLQLKGTTSSLETGLAALDERLASLKVNIKATVAANQKQRAMYLLKTKKWLEKMALERTEAIQKLHHILEQIEHAQTNVEVLSAYKLGAQTLKQVQSAPELQVEKIDAVMDELRDAMDTQKEIDEAMQMDLDLVDQSDIEAELDALMASESNTKDMATPAVSLSPQKTRQEEPIKEVTLEDIEASLAAMSMQVVPSDPLPIGERHEVAEQ